MTDFVQIYRGYVKKYYLASQEGFFEKKKLFFYLQKKGMENGIKISKKISDTCHLPKKNASWLTAFILSKQ